MLISPSSNAEAVSEFVYWIAQRGDGAKIVREHVRGEDGACVACRRRWPCGLRRCAERSFQLRPYPAPPAHAGARRRPAEGAVTIWRGETFWSDGLRYRARWFGRADYPDADAACWWLAISLETLRHRHESGCFWGEVTAGQMENRPDGRDGTVVLVGDWRPVEERGATATAFLRAAIDPITWGGRPE